MPMMTMGVGCLDQGTEQVEIFRIVGKMLAKQTVSCTCKPNRQTMRVRRKVMGVFFTIFGIRVDIDASLFFY